MNLVDKVEKLLAQGTVVEEDDPRREWKCPRCNGYGYLRRPRRVFRCPVCERRVRLAEAEDWIKPYFPKWGITFDDVTNYHKFEANEVYNTLLDFHRNLIGSKPKGLLLHGGNGRGKTEITLATLYNLVKENGIQVMAVPFHHLCLLSKKGLDGTKETETIFRHIEMSSVVFVDELGKEPRFGNEDHAYVHLSCIVDKCYLQKHLIIATNMSVDELWGNKDKGIKPYFTQDIYSRLNSFAGYMESVAVKENADLRG